MTTSTCEERGAAVPDVGMPKTNKVKEFFRQFRWVPKDIWILRVVLAALQFLLLTIAFWKSNFISGDTDPANSLLLASLVLTLSISLLLNTILQGVEKSPYIRAFFVLFVSALLTAKLLDFWPYQELRKLPPWEIGMAAAAPLISFLLILFPAPDGNIEVFPLAKHRVCRLVIGALVCAGLVALSCRIFFG